MSRLVQAMTLRIEDNHEEALAEVKRLKALLEGKGIGVQAFWAIEAGAESGTATVAMNFPNAAAWAALVDSDDEELQAMRRRGVGSRVVVSSSLLQEIDLS